MNHFDHIDDYKAGKLSDEHLALFEAALQSDESLRFAVENYDTGQQLSEALLEADIMDTISQLQKDSTIAPHSIKSNGRTRPMWQKYVLAASVVGLLCLGGYFISQQNTVLTKDEIMAQYYRPPIFDMERGTNPDEMSKLDQAKYAFHSKEYNLAENLFIQIMNTSQDSTVKSEALYYLGHIYLLNSEYKKATEFFTSSGFGDYGWQVEVVGCLVEPSTCTLY